MKVKRNSPSVKRESKTQNAVSSGTQKAMRLYRYSDANTHTDDLTLQQAQRFQRLQNGGTITPMGEIRGTVVKKGSRSTKDNPKYACQNCKKTFAEDQLKPLDIYSIIERVAPGEPMPQGECPNCGAYCHAVKSTGAKVDQRFLVVSYDSDEQQWFYDVVFAESEAKAKERICGLRPYVIDTDAIAMPDLERMTRNALAETREESEKRMRELAQ